VNPRSLEKVVRMGYEQIKGDSYAEGVACYCWSVRHVDGKGEALDIETIEKLDTDLKETVYFVQVLLLQGISNCSARNGKSVNEDKKEDYSEANLIPLERRISTINDSRM
jgi:hypothetical protein